MQGENRSITDEIELNSNGNRENENTENSLHKSHTNTTVVPSSTVINDQLSNNFKELSEMQAASVDENDIPNSEKEISTEQQILKETMVDDEVSVSTNISIGNLSKSSSKYYIFQQQANIHPNFHYNKHNESIFDDERLFPNLPTSNSNEDLVKYDLSNPDLVNHATIKALVVQLTSPEIIDYNLICDFFLTYRMFSNSYQVLDLLLTRLIWSLQYINSNIESNIKIGKLVLLRTFVVLRHWIINYFVDDFNNKNELCDLFSSTLNEITTESNLVKNEQPNSDIFVTKIIGDLKMHWLNLINKFWLQNLDLDSIMQNQTTFHYTLPLTNELSASKKLSKSNTDMSIHTNPSYRRSAMLSLYDQKTHHKMLIFNENQQHQDENPQYSINNLLLHHSSSRVSINNKVQEIQEQKISNRSPAFLNSFALSKSPKPIEEISTPVTPTRLFGRKILSQTTRHNYMNLKDSALELKKTKTISDEKEKENTTQIVHDNIPQVGFSTSGNIKLPSSKVLNVLPPTPVKKMDIIINNSQFASPKKNLSFQPPSSKHIESDIGRRNSMKKLMDSWKKSLANSKTFTTHEVANDGNIEKLISNALNVIDYDIGNRVDALSARIIDELEYLITYYINSSIIHEDKSFVEVPEEIHDKSEVDLQPIDVSSPKKNNDSDIDINDLSELNIVKIDNLINDNENVQTIKVQRHVSTNNILDEISSESNSFQKAASINWNDEENFDLEKSTEDKVEDEDLEYSKKFEGSSFNFQQSNHSFETSTISTPSNITQYDAEISDLGIALSPQSVKPKRISFCGNLNTNHTNIIYNKRFSILSKTSQTSNFKRDSMKSYISYDSAFSVSNDSNPTKVQNLDYGNALRKKNAFHNLRIGNEEIKLSRISARFSTLCALTELPFNEIDEKRESMDMTNSSVFSIAARSRKSTINKDSIQSEAKTISSTSYSVAIPGISNYALKELAAIPDETFQSTEDPIENALHKLEGKHSISKSTSKSQEPCVQVDDTQDILNQIQNANTEDAITYDFTKDDIKSEETPLTPIKTHKTDTDTAQPSSSTPNFNEFSTKFEGSIYQTPKIILDGYSPSTDLLSVENIMTEKSHISFILSYTSQSLAEHFTMIERDMLQEIDWKDLIELKWNRELTPVNSWLEIIVNDDYYNKNKGVNLVISRFNLMVNWIISEILLTIDENERINIISRFIHVAQNCLILQNFSTLMQIILALTSQKVQSLKSTWRNLVPGDILILKNLEELSSPLKNFLNIRLSINQIRPSKGCIPFVGLYLSDLTFNSERSSILKKDEGNSENNLINFSKFRTSVHIVKSLSQCIEWSNNYKMKVQQDLLSKCLYLKSIDEDEMNYCIDILNKV